MTRFNTLATAAPRLARWLATACCLAAAATLCAPAAAEVAIGGFIPLVGLGLTDEYQTFDEDASFFIADPAYSAGGSPLGVGGAHYELALLDTGAATHILTREAYDRFGIASEGLSGTNFQPVGGATGIVNLRINDPMGVYTTGLANRTAAGGDLGLNSATFRGQTSTAVLSAPNVDQWKLPNIIGLPMAAHHALVIRNDLPQVFEQDGRTVRTPQVELRDLGSGGAGAGPGGTDILRRAQLSLNPGTGFIQGPFYLQNLDIGIDLEFNFHDNPQSPTVVENGALFIDVDMTNGADEIRDSGFLFDTGADMTVISTQTAVRLGIDPILDKADFVLEVEGSGGVQGGIPGYYIDELNLDTAGGTFRLQNVPIAVLDVTNPNDPGNVINGILGMHLFNGRNIAIDANASVGQGGAPPALYISDPVTHEARWGNQGPDGAWDAGGEWVAGAAPGLLADAQVVAEGGDRTARVAADALVYRATIAGEAGAKMTVEVAADATLTTYGETRIDAGGAVHLEGGVLDAQYVNLNEGAVLRGEGTVAVGVGPIEGALRNLAGRLEVGGDGPGDLHVIGDLSTLDEAVTAFDLTAAGHDRLSVDRFAFLAGELEVSLDEGVAPQIGMGFELIAAGDGVFGEFDSLDLPVGYLWRVDYESNAVVLTATAVGLQGDYNGNGVVDAADFTVWRDSLGSTTNLAADGDLSGGVGPEDWQVWADNFGNSLPATAAGVPEPGAIAAILLGITSVSGVIRRRRQAV
ncbi:hypothetical protein Mal64_38680 [Pseudobythopirellula maris]|uniref:Peptidase A2 domain-containing protein n=1 Tax=Pseudobythopirellula maris TaxID=2527991 RepID=A0A5C5ZGZ0_9BACT|nr:retropepsin-like aspartic protease [Pseudobythopirellula maris]TWT86327.1 hypothetical protein Mal64_38680 [Pseudobythopirellula maris]